VDGPGPEFAHGRDRLVGRLSPGGSLLVFDRTPDPSQAVRLGAALLHAGLDLDLGRPAWSSSSRGASRRRHPFRRPAVGAPTVSSDELAAWVKGCAPGLRSGMAHELRFEALKADGARSVGLRDRLRPPQPDAGAARDLEHDGAVYAGSRHRAIPGAGRRPHPEALWNEYGAHAGQCAAGGLQVRFHDA